MKYKHYGDLLTREACELVVGIDQSYSGFAVTLMAKSGDPHYQSWVFKAPGTGIDRLQLIRETLTDILSEAPLPGSTLVDSGMEGYAYGAQMAHMAGELGGMVKSVLYQLDTPAKYPLIIPPANIKKYVTGKGTGVQKNQMLLHTFKTFGVEFDDDNAADSYAIAMMVSGRSKNANQKEVLSKLSDPKFREKP